MKTVAANSIMFVCIHFECFFSSKLRPEELSHKQFSNEIDGHQGRANALT